MAVIAPLLALTSINCVPQVVVVCEDGTKHWGICPKPNVTQGARLCRVSRLDCTGSDTAGNCTTTMPVNFDGIACGATDKEACDKFCVNAGAVTVPYKACMSNVVPGATVPTEPAFCNEQMLHPDYNLTCTNQGRVCTVGATAGCLTLADVTEGMFSACEEAFEGPAVNICGKVPNNDGQRFVGAGSRITAATLTKRTTPCATSSALTSMDMAYRLPAGTPVPVSVPGQNLTLTTSGGRMVVTYRCDSLGEFCTPYQIKDFWLGVNPTTINGNALTDIAFTQLGANAFKADRTINATNPGFRVAARIQGIKVTSYFKPTMPIKFTGSLKSAPFTLAGTFDIPLRWGNPEQNATAHVTMNLAGSTYNSNGTTSGVQINCGDNGTIGPFLSDRGFSGGAGKTRTNDINVSGVVNPAPRAVYQSQHYSSPFTYTIPGFAPGSSHVVRLHFAETNPVNNAPNKRKFSVAINGTTQISNLDLFATVGMNKAYVREFTLPADGSGRYVLSFTATLDSATISAIEVF
jgi:hypothetical protein